MVMETIEFLPSTYGTGFLASIYGWYGEHDPDGWVPGLYDGLRGVAVLPPPEELKRSSWKRTVIERLRTNGVLFLNHEQAEKYEAGEGTYWLWKHGLRHEIDTARRVIWTIKKPAMPVNDRATELAQAADLLRQNQA